jgi:hypothetical protein
MITIYQSKVEKMPTQIRLKNQKTPKGQIECPIGDTVKPTFCKKCAYACDCQSYENYLNARISKLREFYWKIRAWFSEWFEYIRYKWNISRPEYESVLVFEKPDTEPETPQPKREY